MNTEQKQASHASSTATQEKIWQHFQNDGQDSFAGSAPRLDYLLQRIRRLNGAKDLRVLNIGIGNAYFEKRCVETGYKTASLDPDANAIQRVKSLGVDAQT